MCLLVSELYINGELDSVTNGGFSKIVIRLGSDQRLEVDAKGITVQLGQNVSRHVGLDPIRTGRWLCLVKQSTTMFEPFRMNTNGN